MDLFQIFYDQEYPSEIERDYKKLTHNARASLLLPFIDWVNKCCIEKDAWDGLLQEDEGFKSNHTYNEMGQ